MITKYYLVKEIKKDFLKKNNFEIAQNLLLRVKGSIFHVFNDQISYMCVKRHLYRVEGLKPEINIKYKRLQNNLSKTNTADPEQGAYFA